MLLPRHIFTSGLQLSSGLRHNSCMKNLASTALLTLLVCQGLACAQDMPQTHLPRTKLSVGMYQIDAQVATSSEQREIGLMFRKDMPQHEGMLFIFDSPSRLCFWMKNTPLPLTAAFVADDGAIVNLEDMKPLSPESHCSTKPVRYVLEMNQGWFAKKGIKPGAKLSGRPFSP